MLSENPSKNPLQSSKTDISAEDQPGLEARALRENTTVAQLIAAGRVRASVADKTSDDPEAQKRQAVSTLVRVAADLQKGIPPDEIKFRSSDPYEIYGAMHEMLIAAGYPMKDQETQDGQFATGPLPPTE